MSAGGEKEGAAESPAAGSTQAEGPEEGVGAAGRVALEPSASEESSKTSRGEKPTSGSGPSAGSTGGKSAGQTALDGQDTSGTQKKAGSKKAAGGEKAPYWEDIERHVSNAHTGKCLVAGADRVVAQSECGTSGAWRRLVVGDGVFLLKYVPADACLDSNGEEMYVSPCTTDDPGQLWRMPSSDHCEVAVSSKQYGEFVTGWNTGSVSLVGAELADEAAKHSWTLSPSLSAGC
ncbi:hypothetical protein ABZ770_16490 [Streptomyces sp. NPDC006654]|uniref:hypothetical protein n=1 Tax=Streptomyces sp. NPDC006654 TaxID=3156897 RepID=UPI0033F4F552